MSSFVLITHWHFLPHCSDQSDFWLDLYQFTDCSRKSHYKRVIITGWIRLSYKLYQIWWARLVISRTSGKWQQMFFVTSLRVWQCRDLVDACDIQRFMYWQITPWNPGWSSHIFLNKFMQIKHLLVIFHGLHALGLTFLSFQVLRNLFPWKKVKAKS